MAHDKMLDGNTAAVEAIKAARVKVISAYPITPQSTIAEKLADAVADGELGRELCARGIGAFRPVSGFGRADDRACAPPRPPLR